MTTVRLKSTVQIHF